MAPRPIAAARFRASLLPYYAKAIAGLLAPAVVILAAPMTNGTAPAPEDYWKALAAALLTAFAVERIGNREVPGAELPAGLDAVGAESEGLEPADDLVAGLEAAEEIPDDPRPAPPGEHRRED